MNGRKPEHPSHDPSSLRDPDDLLAPLPKLEGVVVGSIAAFSESGTPLVQFEGNPTRAPIAARSTIPLDRDTVGRQVVLVFEGNDSSRPIAIGVVEDPSVRTDPAKPSTEPLQQSLPFKIDVDGERLEIRANREIVLCVGKASITLTEAGKILIRGAYLLSRSSGVNRIKGGSVQIN